MSEADVAYSCGSCGYPLNLTSSNRTGIGSEYQKSIKKGVISFLAVDLSRFTQVDQIKCLPISLGFYRPKTKLLCRQCEAIIGYGYGSSAVPCGFDPEEKMDLALGGTAEINLPADCLLNIYDKLQDTCDRNTFGLTCRRWLQIQNFAINSLIFHFSDNPNVYRLYASYLPRLLDRFPNLSSISLAGCSELPDSTLTRLRDCGSRLLSLALYCCFGIDDNGLRLVSTGCPNLVSVTLYRCNITDPGLESLASSCHALENVNLSYCRLITDLGVSAISRSCSKLHAVMISYCRSITGTGFRGCSPTLTYLEADSCVLSPEGLLGTVSGGGLEYLNVSSLRYWCGVDGFGGIGAGFAMKLRFLNLRMCRFISDDSVVAIARGCPLLEEWSLAACHEVRETGWAAIGLDCRNLQVLHVNRCRNLSDGGLRHLMDGCPRLRLLYMYGCRRISSLGYELFRMWRQDVEVRNEECICVGPCIDDLFA